VARLYGRAEEVGQGGEARAGDAPSEQTSGQPHSVDHGRRDAAAGQPLHLAVEKAEVEAGVVRDQDGVSREGEKLPHCRPGGRGVLQVGVDDPGQRGDERGQRPARIDERLESPGGNETLDPHCPDLADPRLPGSQTRRLEVDHDEAGELERGVGARLAGERHGAPAPHEP
jgi:hypothetical protein